MDINGEQTIDAPREVVWEALNNPQVLQECILGCEAMDKITETEMKAVVKAKFGPVKAKFKADIGIEDIELARSCTIVGKGQGGVAGFANGVAKVSLQDVDEGTLLTYVVDFSVGGKIAQIGTRLLSGTTTKIVDHFFETFPTKL